MFADNCGWLVTVDMVEQLCEWLTKARIKMVEWAERNHVDFDNSKDEMVPFT